MKQVVRCCPENVALALKSELVRLVLAMVSACLWHSFWLITWCEVHTRNLQAPPYRLFLSTLEQPTCRRGA